MGSLWMNPPGQTLPRICFNEVVAYDATTLYVKRGILDIILLLIGGF